MIRHLTLLGLWLLAASGCEAALHTKTAGSLQTAATKGSSSAPEPAPPSSPSPTPSPTPHAGPAAKPGAPGELTLTVPAPGSNRSPEISWTVAKDAATYDLVVATDAGCATPVQSLTGLTATSRTLAPLLTGVYHVCLTAVGPGGKRHAANDDALLTILPVVLGQSDTHTNRNVALGLHLPINAGQVGTHFLVADYSNNRVLIWNALPAQGTLPDVVLGQADANGIVANNAGISGATLANPMDFCTDGTRLAVADYGNSRVLIWNAWPTRSGQPADVVLGQTTMTAGAANAGGSTATASSLYKPAGVTCAGGKLYVVDQWNHRVLVWNTFPTQNAQAADLVLGQPDLTSNTLNNGGRSAHSLYYPGKAFVAGTKLYVPDEYNHRVLIWSTLPTTNNADADVVLGQADFASGSVNRGGSVSLSGLYYPESIYEDGTHLFVADTYNNRVLVWSTLPTSSGTAASFALGQADGTSNGVNAGGGAAVPGASTIYYPTAVAEVGSRLVVTDAYNHRVLFWNSLPSAAAPADAALGQPSLTTNAFNLGVAATATTLHYPQAAFSDGTRLILPDEYNHRVLIWSHVPTADGVPPDLVLGQPDFTSTKVNNGGISAHSLYYPFGAYSDGTRLYVADCYNNRILIWTTFPTQNGQDADLVLGQSSFTTGAGNAGGAASLSTLSSPVSINSDGTHLVVSDDGNNRVLIWNQIPTASNTPADVVIGQPNGTTVTANTGGTVTASTLYYPYPTTLVSGKLYIPDTYNNRILIYNSLPTTNGAAADLVLAQPDFASHASNGGGTPSLSTLSYPGAVAVDHGRLYVADSGNHRLLVWNTVPTSSSTPADRVFGQPDAATVGYDTGGLSGTRVGNYSSVAADGTHVFVTDSNDRLLIFPSLGL